MAGSFDDAIKNAIINHVLGTATLTVTTPLKVRLTSTAPTGSTNGTEVTAGGGYTAGGATIAFGSASGGVASNSGAVTWTNVPTWPAVNGWEIWDSSGTPKRIAWGTITTAATVSGDTAIFSAGNVTITQA